MFDFYPTSNNPRIILTYCLSSFTGVLEHASNLLEPQDFVKTLPNDGLLSFFTPFLEQSCRKHKVKLLQTQALTMVKSDDTRSWILTCISVLWDLC